MIHSFINSTNTTIQDPNVFGGIGNDSLTLNLTFNSQLSNITINTFSYGEYPSNITLTSVAVVQNIYPSAYDGTTVSYNVSSTAQLSNIRLTYNSINYNPYGHVNAYIQGVQINDFYGVQIVPQFTSNTLAVNKTVKRNLFYNAPYTCSNTLPFDGDPDTAWYSTNYKASDGTCQVSPYPGFTFTFPQPVTVRGFRVSNSTVKDISINTLTAPTPTVTLPNNYQYYTISTLSGTTFACNVISTLPGMNTCSIGDLALYGNVFPGGQIIRLTPDMTSTSTIVPSNYIMSGGLDVTSNDNITQN
jgi:hypothetical protein